jgi:hypothetical protein
LERQAQDRIGGIRAAYDEWLALHQSATALTAFDPSDAVQALDGQIAQTDAELAKVEAERQRLEAIITDLAGKADAARQKSKAEHDSEAAIRQRAVNATETQRAALLEQAAAKKRAGDAFDKEAAYLAAEIAKQQPNVDIAKRQGDNLGEQRKMLEDAKAGLAHRVAVNRGQADAARAEADKMAKDIVGWLEELKKTRDAMAGPSDQAAQLFGQAVTEANRAGSGGQRGAAGLAPALYQQGLANVLLLRARGNDAYARLLELLSGSTPPVPGGPSGADAAAARKAFDESYSQAKEALAQAMQYFESGGGGSQEVQQRLDRVRSDLDRLAGGTGKVTPTAQPETPEEIPPAAPEPAAAAPAGTPEAEIRAMLGQFVTDIQTRGLEALREHVYVETDQQRELLEVTVTLGQNLNALNAACQEKFQKSLSDILAGAAGGRVGLFTADSFDLQAAFRSLAPDAVDINVTGEAEATVTPHEMKLGASPTHLVKRDTRWLIVMDTGEQGVNAEMAVMMMKGLGDMFGRLAKNLQAGQYADEAAFLQGFQQEAMQPPPGGPK